MQEATEAILIPGECRASFPNLNGGAARWAVSFVPQNFRYTPAIQPCGQPCGRSGTCYQVGGANQVCGKPQPYQFGCHAEPTRVSAVIADL